MKSIPRQFACLIAFGVLGFASVPVLFAEGGSYQWVKEIPIGGEGGWDCLSVDQAGRKLFVTHATKIVAIDLESGKVTGEIADTPGVHAFAISPELQRGYSSNGKENKASIVDLNTLKTLSRVDTGENPDLILYEPKQKEVYVFNGRGKSATVFDASTGKVTATISLSGKPEFAQCDPDAGRVYCNIEDKSEVAVIDSKSHLIVNTWPIAPGTEASGMAIDLARHRLFLACGNKLMVMMDSTDGRVVATVPIGSGVDGCAYDPGTQLAFSSNGEGNVTIAHEETPDKLTVVQTLSTEKGARTMALDLKTHRIYLPTAKFEPQPEQPPGAPRQRPKIIPDTFKVLVYDIGK
jgi:YVTN family beta-propeller protein